MLEVINTIRFRHFDKAVEVGTLSLLLLLLLLLFLPSAICRIRYHARIALFEARALFMRTPTTPSDYRGWDKLPCAPNLFQRSSTLHWIGCQHPTANFRPAFQDLVWKVSCRVGTLCGQEYSALKEAGHVS